MRGSNPSADQSGNELAWILLIITFSVIGYFFWKRIGPPVESASLEVASLFLWPVYFFHWLTFLPPTWTSVPEAIPKISELSSHPDRLSLPLVFFVWNYVGKFYAVLFLPFMMAATWKLSKDEKVVRKFRNKYTAEKLLGTMAEIFPTQTNALKTRMWTRKDDTGRWAAPMNPYVWAVSKGIIKDVTTNRPLKISDIRVERGHPIKPADYEAKNYDIDAEKAKEVFASQLSPGKLVPRKNLWLYPFPIRLLMAIFIAKGLGGKGDRSQEWLDKASRMYSVSADGIPSLSPFDQAAIEDFLKGAVKHPDVKRILETHAHLVPTMMSLLLFARQRGVLVCPEFLWFRGMDTVIWRALNQTGNTVAWVEASGAMAHWQAEIAVSQYAKKPVALHEPRVEKAVEGLRYSLMSEEEGWLYDISKDKRD